MSTYGTRGYSRENRGYRPPVRRDVKASTMNRIIALDEDVGSRYEYDDDEPVVRQAPSRYNNSSPRHGQVSYGIASRVLPIGNRVLPIGNRGERQIIQSRAGKRDIVYQFIVKGAARTGRDSVLKSLASSVDNFKPIAPIITPEGDLEFFLTDQDTADAVKSMTRRIVDRKNPQQKLNIIMKRTPASWDPMKKELKDAIQEVVHSRYNRATNSLDLTEFGTDKKFLDNNINCAFFRNEIIVYVADLIDQNYNFITGLSLKSNRLRSLNFVSTLVFRAPKVKELDLSNNGLSRIEEVEKLKGWSIEKLHLENNELCNKYGNDAGAYTRFFYALLPP